MSNTIDTLKQQRIDRARAALQRARDLRSSRRSIGVEGIRHFVKDVDGDWLEDWANEKEIRDTSLDWGRLSTQCRGERLFAL